VLYTVSTILIGAFPMYIEGSNLNANIYNLNKITASKINHTSTKNWLSINYVFSDTAKTSSILVQDSLSQDSNYLPYTKSAITSKIKYNAKDSIVYDADTKTASLYKDAAIVYDEYDMKAARIHINLGTKLINATGEKDTLGMLNNTPVFKQGSDEYKLEEVTFNYETKRGLMRMFRTQEGDGFIKGKKVKRDEFNNFYIRESYYTTCSEDHPHFSITAQKLKVIPNKKVITGPANLNILGMPTPLVVPFGIFPLKSGQQSGIIIPSYGNALGRGYFLRQGGYYFGLGSKFDLALIGDIFTNGSWQLGFRSNYNNRYKYNGNLSANYAYNKNGLPEDRNFEEFNTFNIRWTHGLDAKAKPGTSFRADVNLVGNQYLAFNTYNTSANTAFQNNINSSVNYNRSFGKGKYNLGASARASQNLATRDLSATLPDLTFSVPSFQPFKPKWKPTAEKWYEKTSINYTGAFQNILTTKDTLLFKQRNSTEQKAYFDSTMRNGFRHAMSLQNSFNLFKYYTLSLGADYNEVWTFKTLEKNYDSINQRVINSYNSGFDRFNQYSFRAGLNTRFYGTVQFKRARLMAIRHVANPDISFSYTPDFGNPRYGYFEKVQIDAAGRTQEYSRFEGSLYGSPSRGRQGNINFGLDNNFEMKWKKGKDTAEKVEKIKIFESLRLSGSYNIFADSLKLSTIPISWRTTLFKTISLNGGATLDPYVNSLITTESGSQFYQRVNVFYAGTEKKLGKITNANMGITAGLNPQMFNKNKQAKLDARKKEMEAQNFLEYKPEWSLNFSYTINYDQNNLLNPNLEPFVQTLSFNGMFNPTKNWFFNFNSGYDFRLNKISHLGIDLRRDLHCWQFTFSWTPLSAFGTQYFIFNIQVKSPTLQDLKVPKRKDWFDTRRI
jgi:hypothetical protein